MSQCITCRHYLPRVTTITETSLHHESGSLISTTYERFDRFCIHPQVIGINCVVSSEAIKTPRVLSEEEFETCPKWCPIYGE